MHRVVYSCVAKSYILINSERRLQLYNFILVNGVEMRLCTHYIYGNIYCVAIKESDTCAKYIYSNYSGDYNLIVNKE